MYHNVLYVLRTLDMVKMRGILDRGKGIASAKSPEASSKSSGRPDSPSINSILGIFAPFRATNMAIEQESIKFPSSCSIYPVS